MTAEDFYKEYYPPKMHLFRDKTDRELQIFSIDQMIDFAERFAELKGKDLFNVRGTLSRDEAEEFLQSKDIWNHPYISDRENKNGYEVADLMAEFANLPNNR